MVVETASAGETEGLGGRLAAILRPGDIVSLAGELGAGKTTFVRGACRALGVSVPVTSPTFTIGHRYDAPVPVAHLDLYRLRSLEDEEAELLGPYVGPGRIAFVEWPDRAADALGSPRLTIELRQLSSERRVIEVRG